MWKKIVKLQVVLKVELNDGRGINCCETKKSQKIILHDLDLTGSFEWNPQWLLSLMNFITLKPIFASGYYRLLYQNLSKNSIESYK